MILPSKVWHVLPVNDSEDHDDYCLFRSNRLPVCKCRCKPEHKEINPDDEGEPTAMIVIHGAFDGRLGVEWANEIL